MLLFTWLFSHARLARDYYENDVIYNHTDFDQQVNPQVGIFNGILLVQYLNIYNASTTEIGAVLFYIFSMYNTHSDIWVVSRTQSTHLQFNWLSTFDTRCMLRIPITNWDISLDRQVPLPQS